VLLIELAATRGQFCFHPYRMAAAVAPLMKRPKRILLYGFGRYREFRDNITAQIIRSLAPRSGLKKIIFPVRFHRKQFVDAITRFKPEIILGLGQSSRSRIDVESQAMNRRRGRRTLPSRMISRTGPEKLKTTLKVRIGRQAGHSSNAGDYVCNFSMYVMLDHVRRLGADVPYGFIHVPHDYDSKKATGIVEEIVGRLSTNGSSQALGKGSVVSRAQRPKPDSSSQRS
jgi:pyroglutamyl-peptidase